jgi:SMODS and SLOG-associating 2TM effector domain 1/Protein of unknown function (DUF4231)
MDEQLKATRESQQNWSATADALKARYEKMRKICFELSIGAALMAAMASQLPDAARAGAVRLGLATTSAAFLAIVGFLTTRFLSGQNASNWIRARAASEALKRAAYTYAVQAAPYDNAADRSEKLAADRQALEAQVDNLLSEQVRGTEGITPRENIPAAEYITKRVEDQKAYYEKRAGESRATARTLRGIELILALVAAVITGIVGAYGKTNIAGVPFDFVALTGVLTTLSGAILAYIEASKLDFIVTSYLATARQLRELIPVGNKVAANAPSPEWSNYVQNVETVLATENSAWMAKVGQIKEG